MIRDVARSLSKCLPTSVRARIAARRFGYTSAGTDLHVVHRSLPDGNIEFTFEKCFRILVTPDAEDDLSFHLIENGESRNEMASFLRMSRGSAADALLIDVGAHKGLFSIVHLLAAVQHRAVLIEPSPPLASGARRLLGLNGVAHAAEVRVAGAGEEDGSWTIVTDALDFAQSAAPGDPSAVTVPLVTLDHLCESSLYRPDIIKIDVEGAEGQVLRGARETIRRWHPIIFLELHLDILERRKEPLGGILDPLSALGYRLETPSGDPMALWRLKSSLQAIVRVVARPAEATR